MRKRPETPFAVCCPVAGQALLPGVAAVRAELQASVSRVPADVTVAHIVEKYGQRS